MAGWCTDAAHDEAPAMMNASDRVARASSLVAKLLAFASSAHTSADPQRRSGTMVVVATEVVRTLAALVAPLLVALAGLAIFLWCLVAFPGADDGP
jgi:hypothetical protein